MRLIDELAGLVQLTDQRPDIIIGGHWPAKIPGARRVSCADCRAFVALSPASGAPMAARFPDVPVVCLACGQKRAKAAKQ